MLTLQTTMRLRAAQAKATAKFVLRRRHRRRAVAIAEYVAANTPHEGRSRRVALRRLRARAVSDALVNRRDVIDEARFDGEDTLRRALASNRGVVLATLHTDAMWGAIRVFVSRGIKLHIVVGPWFWDDGVGVGGTLHRQMLEAEGVVLISTDVAGVEIPRVLKAGGACVITLDIPGRRSVDLAGKRAVVQPAIGKVSSRTGALVVPVFAAIEGVRIGIDAYDPIDPADLGGPMAVLAAVAAALSKPLAERCYAWSPHTSELWPDSVAPYLWAFEG